MANKSVLELAVQTGQWDAGLKKAKTALQNFTDASGGLQKALTEDSASMQKFVQMMGRTDSQAKTAKGQLNDYKSTIEQLTMQYNQMNDAQKQSIGQDYLRSIDQLKQKYQAVNQQIQEMNRSLAGMPDVKPASGGGGLFGGGKLDGMLQVFGGNVMTKIAGMGAGLVTELGDAVKQGIELAKQGEGIRIAFERLGRGDILQGLREATHGTVTDLELMKAAVKFNDFKLPLDELGTMLAFAQQKAKDTGQSVDYMVDSIVTGLGRKSLMILDNLGLSAAQIKEKMKETGDMTKAVGAIIREEMAKAGDYVETAADRATQANVNLQNKMEELGRKFAPLEEASNNFWTSMKIGILDVVGGPLTSLLNKLTEAGRLMNAYGVLGGNSKTGRMISNLSNAREGNRQNIYSQQVSQFWRYINPREQQIKDIRAWQSGQRSKALQGRISAITEKYGSLDATKIQAEVDAAKKMLADYQHAAKSILGDNKPASPLPPSGNNGSGTTSPVPVKIEGFDFNAAASAGVRGIDTMPSVYGMADRDAMRAAMGIAPQQWDAKQDISKQWRVGKNGQLTNKPNGKESEIDGKLIGEEMEKITTGVMGVFNGIEQLGIELPQGLKDVLGGIQAVAGILTAISALVSVITSIQGVKAVPVVGTFLAGGGIVPRAAGGYMIPGNSFSGDNVFAGNAWVNSGELVLNKAQQSTLASQLQGSGMGNMQLEAIVSGEALRFVLNSNGRRTGRGEIVTTNFR